MMRFQVPPRADSLNHTPIRHVNNLLLKLIDGKVLDPEKYVQQVERELRKWRVKHIKSIDWRQQLTVLSWRHLSHALQSLTIPPAPIGIRRWASLAVSILRHEDVSAQVGWERTGLIGTPSIDWSFRSDIQKVEEIVA
jgi:hypothetical protein